MFIPKAVVLVLLLSMAACAELPTRWSPSDVGIDGVACTGAVASAIPGLSETRNLPLQQKAQFPSGKGGVCAAKAFSVTAPVVLYRVFDTNNPHSKFGSWWALKRPSGPKEDYRAANAICKEWSNLDRLISCELRPGSEIVVGTTQSALCADGSTYPKTAESQVYVANDGRAGILHVGACSEETPWP